MAGNKSEREKLLDYMDTYVKVAHCPYEGMYSEENHARKPMRLIPSSVYSTDKDLWECPICQNIWSKDHYQIIWRCE